MHRNLARFALSALVTGALCGFLLREVDLGELTSLVRRAHRPLLAGFLVLSLAGLLARALRYRILLGGEIAFLPLLLVTAARNFLVDLLPARVGSLSYVYLLTRRLGARLEPVLSSFLLSFTYDLLAMALLIAVALLLELGRFEGAGTLAALLAIFAAGSVAAFVSLAPGLRLLGRAVERFSGPARAARIEATAAEIARAGGPGRIAAILGLSVAIRGIKFAAYWLLLLAVLHERGVESAALPFWRVFLGIAGAELSATLPVHGIAGFGTYETAWTLGFTRLGLDRETAILSGFATHLLSQVYDYSLGLVALAVMLAWRPGGGGATLVTRTRLG